eukprot:11173296-Lingulodinium_polyedra.AAC.1
MAVDLRGRPPNACSRRSKTLASAAPSYSWRSQGRATPGTDVRVWPPSPRLGDGAAGSYRLRTTSASPRPGSSTSGPAG